MDATTSTAPSEDVVMEDSDDPQLTIRIPNPKVFMVRQSLWVGHRGKLRCDQCRIHNLKCDRQQPACNQCTWVSGRECKYTPLPTPAHRGVPRCDSCRLRNLKCDRNLPICDQCELNSNPHCVYSPKRRKKQSGLGRSGSKNEDDSGSDAPPEAVAQSIIIPKPKPHISNLAALSAPPAHHLATPYQSPSSVSFSMKHQSGLYAVNAPNRPFRRIQPWSHASFLPLPNIVMQGIAAINAAEMPARVVFETELDQFLAGLALNIRDTACMSLEVYSNVVKYLSGRQGTQISSQLRNWLDLHHFRSGSTKYSVLLTPRDATFTLERPEEDKILSEYRAQADKRTLEFNVPVEDELLSWWNAYDVVPVRNQIYDLMVYAHRSHGSSNEMFHEIAKLNIANVTWPMVEIFHQLCPYCANASAARPQPPRVKVEENMKT